MKYSRYSTAQNIAFNGALDRVFITETKFLYIVYSVIEKRVQSE